MQSNPLQTPDAYGLLDRIFGAFSSGERLIPVTSFLKLTKTQKAISEALLLNDVDLTKDVMTWIDSRSSAAQILERYGRPSLPPHYPARVVRGLGSICSGQNIFLFFPNCLGIEGRNAQDFFGIELIDIWANIFQKCVLPCARSTFSSQSQIDLLPQIGVNLDKTIYLASIFHEVGHQVGSWRVSPTADPSLKTSAFYLDVFGEMSTDSMLVNHLEEFPEIATFVVLQRLFWFGRRGFRDNPHSALINLDNDSWLSALLWNRLRAHQALTPADGRWHLNFANMMQTFRKLSADLELAGAEVLALPSREAQDAYCLEWMKNEVAFVEESGFVLPLELREVYRRSVHIEEIPHFQPMAEPLEYRSIS